MRYLTRTAVLVVHMQRVDGTAHQKHAAWVKIAELEKKNSGVSRFERVARRSKRFRNNLERLIFQKFS